jgi:hypothetical protein
MEGAPVMAFCVILWAATAVVVLACVAISHDE